MTPEEINHLLAEDRRRHQQELEGLTEEQQIELMWDTFRIEPCPPLSVAEKHPPRWWQEAYRKAKAKL